MVRGRTGTLIIIGGHEDKCADPLILQEITDRIGAGKLVVATVASRLPDSMWEEYQRVFRRLGVKHLYRLDVVDHEDACSDAKRRILEDADGVFFTGGDQIKITSLIGASPICERLREIYHGGGLVCGTSAGASVMSNNMIVGSGKEESARVGNIVRMAPGLALVDDILIDQHFAERGRIGRLMGAVAQNPRLIGIGIDEDTAIVVTGGGRRFRVLGKGAVYVVNAWDMTYTSLSEEQQDRALSMYNTRLDLQSQGDVYDFATRRPFSHPADVMEDDGGDEGEAKSR